MGSTAANEIKPHLSIKGSEWKITEGVGHNLLVPDKIAELAETILEFIQHQ